MPTPFPGMDPYLDRPRDWGDLHDRFVPHLGNVIEQQLPEPFRSRINENVYIHELSAEERLLIGRPDVLLTKPLRGTSATAAGAAATTLAATAAGVPSGIDIVEINYLEILDKRNNKVVTAIEVMSPTNKNNDGDAEVYRTKLHQYLRSSTNFIEIDLLRSGRRTNWSHLTPSDYSIVVSRPADRPRVDHWPINLRDRLPVIPIPLVPGIPELAVDLQQILNDVYDAARYGRYIYSEPPDPPLNDDDAKWAEEILNAAGIPHCKPS